MTYLITGNQGYVGSILIEYLKKRNIQKEKLLVMIVACF